MQPDLPELAGEDHTCAPCALAYVELSVPDATAEVGRLPGDLAEALAAMTPAARSRRPDDGSWSVTEYVCHLRDVYVSFTIRLYRARTEDEPAVEPLFNDLRARRFGYHEREALAVLTELFAAVDGFVEEVAHVRHDGWERTVTRRPGERRTARWLVRQAAHEGRHHLDDIRRVGAQMSAGMS